MFNSILALDLGTDCGWAISAPGVFNSGVWRLKPSKFDSPGVRFEKFRRLLEQKFIFENTEKVYFESVRRHLGIDAAHIYGGFVAILEMSCLNYGIEFEGVPVQTIKRHATGSGNADKMQMVAAAVRKYPSINILNDDHADALHLLDYALTISK